MRSLAQNSGQSVEFKIPAAVLGRSPVSVEAIAFDADGRAVASMPLEIVVEGSLLERGKSPDFRE